MARRKSLIRQAQERFDSMAAYGQSKHEDKLINGGMPAPDKLYSYETTETYLRRACAFLKYAREEYGCRSLEEARTYATEYLLMRLEEGYSAWTVHTEAAAIAKLYGCGLRDFGVKLPRRERRNILRNRETKDDPKYELIRRFCTACGVRYHELEKLRPEDVRRGNDGNIYVTVRRGKGGKHRTCLALDEFVLEYAEAAAAEGRECIFTTIPEGAPVHYYRRLYAQAIYRKYARPIAELSRHERYYCRKDMKGIVFDRRAMEQVSWHLGHNRLDVTTTYLKGMEMA